MIRQRCIFFGLITSFTVHANVLQYFTGISFSNPAELFKIEKNEFILGGTGFATTGHFEGTVLNLNHMRQEYGRSDTHTVSLLPYGRLGKRYNEQWVFDVDIMQPFHSNLNWNERAVTRFAATQTYLTDVDVSPRFSYSINQQLKVGAGLDLNFLNNNETNWSLPSGLDSDLNLINRTHSFGLGYDLGVFYAINKSNFISVAYFSRIRQNTKGESLFGNYQTDNLLFNFSFPATTMAQFVHIFNPTWLISLQAYYSEWSVNQHVRFFNTAAPKPLSPHFHFKMEFGNSVAGVVAVRHQWTEKLGITLLGVMDDGPEKPQNRPLNFPSDTQQFAAIVADYGFSNTTSIELLYGFGFLNTTMQNKITIGPSLLPFTTGRTHIHANVLDLRVKVRG